MSLPFFLSRRIYGNDNERHKASRPAIKIASLGVAIGLAVMIISVSVVIGFKRSIRDKVAGFGGHIQVVNFMNRQAAESYPVVMNDSMLNVLSGIQGVKHAERFCMAQGLLKTDDNFLGIVLKGVAGEWDPSFIGSSMREGELPVFSDRGSSNKIIVSQSIADKLRLKPGDRIFAYFFDGEAVRTRRFSVSGIYETNLSQYDDMVCFTDLYTILKINGLEEDQAFGAELSVTDFNKLDETKENVVKRISQAADRNGNIYSAQTIRELNPQIFAWLDLLDMNIWIILVLMALVACVTMVSGLLIIILERTVMIGILKALGARNSTIQGAFLWFGIFITGKGMFIGDIIAMAVLAAQRLFGIVKLDASIYYVNTVPVDFNIPLFLLINAATLLLSIIVLLLPSLLVSRIKPAKAMRFE